MPASILPIKRLDAVGKDMYELDSKSKWFRRGRIVGEKAHYSHGVPFRQFAMEDNSYMEFGGYGSSTSADSRKWTQFYLDCDGLVERTWKSSDSELRFNLPNSGYIVSYNVKCLFTWERKRYGMTTIKLSDMEDESPTNLEYEVKDDQLTIRRSDCFYFEDYNFPMTFHSKPEPLAAFSS